MHGGKQHIHFDLKTTSYLKLCYNISNFKISSFNNSKENRRLTLKGVTSLSFETAILILHAYLPPWFGFAYFLVMLPMVLNIQVLFQL